MSFICNPQSQRNQQKNPYCGGERLPPPSALRLPARNSTSPSWATNHSFPTWSGGRGLSIIIPHPWLQTLTWPRLGQSESFPESFSIGCKKKGQKMLSVCLLKQLLATVPDRITHRKRPWCWERLKVGEEGDYRGWDGWMASPTQWTWVWVNPRSWWWTGRPGDMESYHRVGYDWATDLNCGHQKSENSILNKTVCLSCKASSCITSVSPLCSPTRYPVRSSYCKLLTLSTCLEALGSWQPWE